MSDEYEYIVWAIIVLFDSIRYLVLVRFYARTHQAGIRRTVGWPGDEYDCRPMSHSHSRDLLRVAG